MHSAELAAHRLGEFSEHGWGGAERSEDLAKAFYRRAGAVGLGSIHRLEEVTPGPSPPARPGPGLGFKFLTRIADSDSSF